MICYIKGMAFRRFSLSDPLIRTGLSYRAYNVLTSSNVQTIQDLLCCTRKQLDGIQGLGLKSREEVLDFLYHLHTHPDGQRIYPLTPDLAARLGIELPARDPADLALCIPEQIRDQTLDELPLSKRAYNCLRRSGIHTVGALLDRNRKELLQIRNLGKGTADEIFDLVDSIFETYLPLQSFDPEYPGPAEVSCLIFYRCVFQTDPLSNPSLYREIMDEFAAAHQQGRPVDYGVLYEKPFLRQVVSGFVTKHLADYPFGLGADALFGDIPPDFMLPEESFHSILSEMQQAGAIRIEKKITLRRLGVLEFADIIRDKRLKDMIVQRLHGVTLKSIADKYGITDERVRQLILKGIRKYNIQLEEDKYIPIFESYLFSKQEFMAAFGERAEVFNYLNIVCTKRQRPPISRFRNDQNYPEEILQGVSALLHTDWIRVNGEYIERNRFRLSEYLLRSSFREDMAFDDFVVKYNEALHNLGLEEDPKLILNLNSFLNHLRLMDFLLWKPGRRFRYYDINSRCYDELFNTLQLDRYHNAEYSTRKFFLAEPELMKKYDIRDEHELHNLLRKVCEKREIKGITFLRTPIISFGVSNRSQQVYDILLAHSPMSQCDFVTEYDAVYGLNPNINLRYYLGPFAQYCCDGVYDVRYSSSNKIREGAAAPPPRQNIPISQPGC